MLRIWGPGNIFCVQLYANIYVKIIFGGENSKKFTEQTFKDELKDGSAAESTRNKLAEDELRNSNTALVS